MRSNIYIRLLLSIVLVTVFVLSCQILFFIGSTVFVERNWKKDVFEGYVDLLETTFSGSKAFTFTEMINMMVSSAPDRVSGILIRDEEGNVNISIGSSGRGELIPQLKVDKAIALQPISADALTLPRTLEISVSTTREYRSENVSKPRYIVNMTSSLVGREMSINSFSIEENMEKGYDVVNLPTTISRNDIAGSILFYNNGHPYGYVDVIVYDIDMYGPVSMIIESLFKAILGFLPFAIAATLIAGYFISRNNARYIKDIQEALVGLSEGRYESKLSKSNIKIRELKMIASSINELGQDLERHQKSRKEWIRNISHDLNTPVTSMNMLLSAAQDGLCPLDQKLVSSLIAENNILMSRIASVAFYSRLLSPDLRLDILCFSLKNLIAEFSLDEDEYYVSVSDVEIKGDYSLIRRAVSECLKNAQEYKTEGHVDVSTREEAGYHLLQISNVGSLPEPRPQFFEPWARGDESRHNGGSGLGLPIVYQIMELHAGKVDITEEGGIVTTTLKFQKA